MLAIHNSAKGFHTRWAAYCQRNGIEHKRVNCYASDIIEQVKNCQAVMWHHGQSDPKDILVARPILSALEHAGIKVFPDFRTAWHFDDKVAQKHLFEALDIPAVPAHVFVDRGDAMAWVEQAEFPKVFKLRRGAGSAGVKLVKDRRQARKLIRKAFGRGFPVYDPWDSLNERIYKWRLGKFPATEIWKGLARFVYPPRYSRVLGPERGYVYFQEFLADNDCDIRIVVVGDRAFGIRRLVRKGDFRASGSGRITYAREDLDEKCVDLAFQACDKLNSACAAFDFVYDEHKNPRILEVSFGFMKEGYDPCEGYWDRDLHWNAGAFDPYGWMVEQLLQSVSESSQEVISARG